MESHQVSSQSSFCNSKSLRPACVDDVSNCLIVWLDPNYFASKSVSPYPDSQYYGPQLQMSNLCVIVNTCLGNFTL